MDDPALWVALRDTPGLSRRDAHLLLERFGTPSELFRRSEAELRWDCGSRIATALLRSSNRSTAEREVRRSEALGLRLIPLDAPALPRPLAEIPDPPLVIYAKGVLRAELRVAIVGSRRPTARGKGTARQLAASCAQVGVVVVSGLAYGIDAAAHSGALDGAGATIAVLASGLDRPSPSGNRALAHRLLDAGGTWLSEHPPGVPALPHHFPERNRLISGLAPATLVVEARERSGSLWTARHALDQGRDVLVVPGPVDVEHCRGSNALLRQGAIPVLSAEDLLGDIAPERLAAVTAKRGVVALSDDGERLLACLRQGPAHSDELALALGASPQALAALLLELELSGVLVREGSRVALRSSV